MNRKNLISKIVETLGGEQLVKMIGDQFLGDMGLEGLSHREVAVLRREFDASAGEILTALEPAYGAFSMEELQAMLDFYGSPAGKSILAKMPGVTQQSVRIGQAMGEKIANRAMDRLHNQRRASVARA